MHKIRERLVTEGFYREEGRLSFSVKQVELCAAPEDKTEGFFIITSTGLTMTEGFISTDDERMQCLTPWFSGSTEQIEYRFDATGMQEGEKRSGRFFIVSNHGEYSLAWKVQVTGRAFETSLGEVQSLLHFTNLARASWQEAVRFFYGEAGRKLFLEEQEEVSDLYRGFSAHQGNEANVEEFLIAASRKQPISFTPVQRELRIEDVKGQVCEELRILKNGWGPVHLLIEAKGDFLSLERTWIGEDDFLGNLCRLPVFLDETRMHEGRNFGEITVTSHRGSFVVPVVAKKCTLSQRGKDRRRIEYKQCNVRMVKLYQQLRTRQLSMEEWRSQARECVEQMAHLSGDKAVPRLFTAQILLTEDKQEEAGWILGQVRSGLNRDHPAVYCYYLYLTTLHNREESYGRRVTEKVKEIFAANPGEWRIAWLLLFLSRELNRSAARKWQFLTEQFQAGCTSPVLYLEALQLLNASPTLLSGMDETARRLLMYGGRRRLLGADLCGYVTELIGREKYYDPVLFTICRLMWEQYKDVDTLQAACGLLIKGGKTGPAWYFWYFKGVQKKLRITRLYEHYLMSVDLNRETEIPRSVLLYFAYQSNLDYEYAAYLYAYVVRHKEKDPELYLTYRPLMDRFVLSCLYKGRINRHLAYLYRELLTGPMLTKENQQALAGLWCMAEISCQDPAPKKLVVVHTRLKGERSWVLHEGRVCAELYSSRDLLFTEDTAQNRRLLRDRAVVTPLFERPGRLPEGAKAGLGCHLVLTDTQQIQLRQDNADSYLALVREPVLTFGYGRRVRLALLSFLEQEGRSQELNLLLQSLKTDQVEGRDRPLVARSLVLQGFYEKAYEWLDGADYSALEPELLLRLCSRLLEKQLYTEQKRMTQLCFYTAMQGKYDDRILRQLTAHYQGSIAELEAVKLAAEGFGLDTYRLCERMIEQLLFTDSDVTERTALLRQYVREGGQSSTELCFVHRCAYSYVMEEKPIHTYLIHDILRMLRAKEPVTDLCRIACLQYYAKNRDAVEEDTAAVLKEMGVQLLAAKRVLPVLKEFADLVPGAELLADRTFVVYRGRPGQQVVLHCRFLQEDKEQEDYQTMELPAVYEGLYARAFILFPGEKLQYFITLSESAEQIADSGLLMAGECSPAVAKSRYGMLGAAALQQLAAGTEDVSWQSLELLEQYFYTDYCVRTLFLLQD